MTQHQQRSQTPLPPSALPPELWDMLQESPSPCDKTQKQMLPPNYYSCEPDSHPQSSLLHHCHMFTMPFEQLYVCTLISLVCTSAICLCHLHSSIIHTSDIYEVNGAHPLMRARWMASRVELALGSPDKRERKWGIEWRERVESREWLKRACCRISTQSGGGFIWCFSFVCLLSDNKALLCAHNGVYVPSWDVLLPRSCSLSLYIICCCEVVA